MMAMKAIPETIKPGRYLSGEPVPDFRNPQQERNEMAKSKKPQPKDEMPMGKGKGKGPIRKRGGYAGNC